MLFKDAPDLLAEFKDFLPEVGVGGALGSNAIGLMPAPGHPDSPWAQPSVTDKSKKRIPGVPPKRKRRTAEKEPTPVPVPPPPKPAQSRVSSMLHSLKHPSDAFTVEEAKTQSQRPRFPCVLTICGACFPSAVCHSSYGDAPFTAFGSKHTSPPSR